MTSCTAAKIDVYGTAPFPETALTVDVAQAPARLVHAKRIGTTTTLCGLSTWSWFKFMDRPFIATEGVRCGACMRALAATQREVKGR